MYIRPAPCCKNFFAENFLKFVIFIETLIQFVTHNSCDNIIFHCFKIHVTIILDLNVERSAVCTQLALPYFASDLFRC